MARGGRRSVQPLPAYTRREPLAGGRWGYYFKPPTWALKPKKPDDRGPCPVGCEPLGNDYDAAVKRVGTVGRPLYAERRTPVNHAMGSCRRAWNVAMRLHPKDVPAANPFAKMGLVSRTRSVAAATYADLLAAVAQADATGLPSLGTALMLTWEWLQ